MDRGLQRTAKGMWIRTISVAIFDALIVFAIPQLVANQSWTLFGFLIGAAILVNWAYLSPRASASRWLTPGLVLMAIFVVYPVFYTFYVSLTNWRTGNFLSKDQAISALEAIPMASDGTDQTLPLSVYTTDSGELAFLIGGGEAEAFFGTPRPNDSDPIDDSSADTGGAAVDPAAPPETLGDYTLIPRLRLAGMSDTLQNLILDLPDGRQATLETLSSVTVRNVGQRFTYDPTTDTLVDNQTQGTCVEGTGTFLCDGVPEDDVARAAIGLEGSTITCTNGVCDQVPTSAIESRFIGWRALIGFDNYADIFTNRRIQEPFLRVFAWNIVFAFSSVILTFAMGLMLAIALQDESMRGRALYRSIYIIPYAIPGFLSILIWRGLLNERFGKVNGVLEAVGIPGPDWLGNQWWVLVAILLVNLWLGFPYMFLISSGALTSVPIELQEAARVDGASPFKVFRSVTLPLLLVSTAPLLIGAFAFNFNNFVLIFLLSAGGPPLSGYDVPVGASDLLISFTFNLAQGAGRGNQFALASAVIVIIFVVLAVSAATSFRLTKRLEEIYGG
ncbi:MAG: ABC transporter permease subunit [Actinobacteria bacterium]|nr:ABC transporter permease subunit [Actinomycetota bacterium]